MLCYRYCRIKVGLQVRTEVTPLALKLRKTLELSLPDHLLHLDNSETVFPLIHTRHGSNPK